VKGCEESIAVPALIVFFNFVLFQLLPIYEKSIALSALIMFFSFVIIQLLHIHEILVAYTTDIVNFRGVHVLLKGSRVGKIPPASITVIIHNE